MGALGDMVSNAVDAAAGKSGGTNLQTFLDKFSSAGGRWVDTLDPLSTFDVKFKFFPSLTAKELAEQKPSGLLGRVGQSLANSAVSMAKGALNSATGGLFQAWQDSGSVKDARKDFKDAGKHTFMEYLAPAHGLQGGEQWSSPEQAAAPLELSLGPYVQKINGLQLQMGNEGKADTALGDFPVNGTFLKPSGELQMEIVNTKAALHERLFYPWMRECVNPWWSYEGQPYTTATVDIDFTKHNDVHYIFTGVRPKQIKLLDASQQPEAGNLVREVVFMYDFMFVTSSLAINDKAGSKLMGAAGGLLGGAGKMLNV